MHNGRKRAVVFVRRKGEERFDERPADVVSCHREGPLCFVTFRRTLKMYPFQGRNVAICTPSDITVANEIALVLEQRADGAVPIWDAAMIVRYASDNPEFEDRLEVRHADGTSRLFAASSLFVVTMETDATTDVLDYLATLAGVLSAAEVSDDAAHAGYLAHQYERLSKDQVWNSAACHLAWPAARPCVSEPLPSTIIYPFGCNLSQELAVERALTSSLSLIEGPPGTGKTQTILNIVANLVLSGRSVLVVSPNNDATKNVEDKLAAVGLGFIVAALGNREHREAFVANQPPYPAGLDSWKLSAFEREQLRARVHAAHEAVHSYLEQERELRQAEAELRAWEEERDRLGRQCPDVIPLHLHGRADVARLEALRDRVRTDAEFHGRIRLTTRIVGALLQGAGRWADWAATPVALELRLDATIVEARLAEVKTRVSTLCEAVEAAMASVVLDTLVDGSKTLFRDALAKRYLQDAFEGGRVTLTEHDLWWRPQDLRLEYPVITSTTNAARAQLGIGAVPFDWVIVDESSQADLVTGLLALSCAHHAVVVGDTHQLPCVVTLPAAEAATRVFAATGLPERYDYARESLLSCLGRCNEECGMGAPATLLAEHYRSLPAIINFCNQQFYDGALIAMREDQTGRQALRVLLTNDENYDRAHDYNRVQAELVAGSIIEGLVVTYGADEVGVVCPYRRQVTGMAEEQWEIAERGVEIDTVHSYQGREKRAMVFVTCANDANDFVDDPNLINVAVSRARDELVVVASPRMARGQGNVADLIRYAARLGAAPCETGACSIFDLVYPAHTSEREAYLRERGATGDQYTEVAFLELIEAALDRRGLQGRIHVVRNYPLAYFCRGAEDLTEEERSFVESRAHADFLLFRTIDKTPVFEIEVNGSQHAGEVQRLRDERKAAILDKARVPHAAITTNAGEDEAARLVERVMDAICAADNPRRHARNTAPATEATGEDVGAAPAGA